MDKELKTKWLEALRSGKYKQGKGYLRNRDNEFCCLGVLCDVKNPKGWVDNNGPYGFERRYNVLMPFFDYYNNDNYFCYFNTAVKLSGMNDGNQEQPSRSFSEIADWIEVNIK